MEVSRELWWARCGKGVGARFGGGSPFFFGALRGPFLGPAPFCFEKMASPRLYLQPRRGGGDGGPSALFL